MKKILTFISTILVLLGLSQLPASADMHIYAYAPNVATNYYGNYTLNVALSVDTTRQANGLLQLKVTLNSSVTDVIGGGAPRSWVIDQSTIVVYNGTWCTGNPSGWTVNPAIQTTYCNNMAPGTIIQVYYAITGQWTDSIVGGRYTIQYQYITFPFGIS